MNKHLLKELNTIKSRMGLVVEQEKKISNPIGLKVMVYYNLHKKTFSIQ